MGSNLCGIAHCTFDVTNTSVHYAAPFVSRLLCCKVHMESAVMQHATRHVVCHLVKQWQVCNSPYDIASEMTDRF